MGVYLGCDRQKLVFKNVVYRLDMNVNLDDFIYLMYLDGDKIIFGTDDFKPVYIAVSSTPEDGDELGYAYETQTEDSDTTED